MRWPMAGLLLSASLAAPSASAGIWDALAGRWQGSGDVRGMKAELALEFQPALQGKAYRLSFRNHMRAADGSEWPFAAEAIYLCDAQQTCRGHWYDTRGAILPLATTEQVDALVVEWGDATTERGRTTYRVQGERIDITDEVRDRTGVWKVFGRSRVIRSPE